MLLQIAANATSNSIINTAVKSVSTMFQNLDSIAYWIEFILQQGCEDEQAKKLVNDIVNDTAIYLFQTLFAWTMLLIWNTNASSLKKLISVILRYFGSIVYHYFCYNVLISTF